MRDEHREREKPLANSLSRRGLLLGLTAAAASLLLTGCATSDKGLSGDPAKKLTAAKIISSFENSTTEIQYNFAGDIDDGRGITAGRAGFTTRDGDLLAVVQQYTRLAPGNDLVRYLPTLEALASSESRSTDGLDGFIIAWENITDPKFKEAQDEVVDEMYFNPAMAYAENLGIKSSLGQLIIFDTIIQHGEGEDADGLPNMINEAKAIAGQTAKDETEWLRTFLEVRRKHLMNAQDPDTRKEWRESVGRVDGLLGILNTGNLALKLPLEWDGL